MQANLTINPTEIMLLDKQLCFALYSSSLAMTKLYKPLLDKLGLTYPQYLVMLALWEQDTLSVTALGERLFLDSGTLTPLLKRMESSGWLVRQRSLHDERRVLVSLTENGRSLRAAAQHIPAYLIETSGCTLPELNSLTLQLQKLRNKISISTD
jgi:DNA-binding MarR family transcriptional regulator